MKMKDKALLTFLGLVVVAAFLGGQWWNEHKEFTTEKWVSYTGNSRQAIINNFIDRTVIEGITPEALKEYLGEGEKETEDAITYFLGQPGILGGVFPDKNSPNEYYVITFVDGLGTKAEILPETLASME